MSDITSVARIVTTPTILVQYNNCSLSPAPFVQMTVEPQFDDEGIRQSVRTNIVLTGSIVILPTGSYEQLYDKQEEIRTLFAEDEKDFTIVAGPGNKTLAEGTVICSGLTPKVKRLDFPGDIQVNKFDYTIELEDNTAASGVSGVVSSFSNQWSFTENPESCTLDVTHTVSAEGLDGEADAFEQAVIKVKDNLGIDQLPLQLPCFVQPNASGDFGFTHPSNPAGGPIFEVSVQREEQADVANGSYSVTEVFTIVSGVPFYFNTKTTSFQEDGNGVASVTVQGTIQGLGRTNTPGLGLEGGVGFQRAQSGFLNVVLPNLPNEATDTYNAYKTLGNASGLITGNPTAYSITESKCRGTVGFSITYTDDIATNLPSGISVSTASVQRTEGNRQFAFHPIPLRRLGPLVQDIKTTTEGNLTITASATAENTGDPTADTNRAIQQVEDEINRLRSLHARPADFIAIKVAPGSPDQTINDRELTCQATIAYVFTVDLTATIDENSVISLKRV